MADLQTILQALRNAEASGNTADAQRLAILAQQAQQTPSADPNAPDTGLMTGIANRALAIGEGLMNLPDTVTEAVTGYKDPRLLVPEKQGNFLDIDWANIGDSKFVENTPDIQKLENPLEKITGLRVTGDEFENAGKFLQEKREALNYAPKVPWNEVKSNPTPQNVLGFMGEAAITSLPDMAAALISAPAYFASYVAPIAQKRAENDGGRDVTPEDLAYAAVASAGIASAERFGAKGIFGDVYGNVAQRITGAGVREGATEAVQNPLQYAAETVNTETGFDPIEALDQAAAGAVGGTGAGVGLRTATEVATGGSMREPEDREAAAALANRLDATAKADKLNPRNVSNRVSTKGARALLDQTHVELSEEIQDSYDNLGKAIKKDKKNDDAETARLKRLAKAGLRQAKNKVKNTVGTRELDAVRILVGNTREGQQLVNLMRESNELTTLHNRGLKGGLSKYTDMVAPLSSGSGYNPRPLIEVPTRAALTGTAAINTGGASLAPQAAIYLGGRLVDMVTGKRSNVANFIKNNKDAANLPAATGINIDESRVNKKEPSEKQKKINRQLFDENAPIVGNPNKPSPQLVLYENTGLDRQGIYNTAEEMKADPKYDTIKDELNQVQRSITQGGTIDELNAVASLMAGYLGVKAEANTRVAPLQQAKIQQGINDNRERIESLRQQAMQDTALNDFDRQLINDALDDLKRDLGTNPVETAERIVSSAGTLARNKASVTRYLNPYLDRVRQQQKRKKSDASDGALKVEINEDVNFQPLEEIPFDDTLIEHEERADKLRSLLQDYVITLSDQSKAQNGKIDKEKVRKAITYGVSTLDPEGRNLVSQIQVGLKGEEGISPEDTAKLTAMMVDAFQLVEKPAEDYRGQYRVTMDKEGNEIFKAIRVQDAGVQLSPSIRDYIDPISFANTVLHELGHAVEAQSKLRRILEAIRYTRDSDQFDRKVHEQAVDASVYRRPDAWKNLQNYMRQFESRVGKKLPRSVDAAEIAYGDPYKTLNDLNLHFDMNGRADEIPQLEQEYNQLLEMLRYYFAPAELGADAVAYYMAEPKEFKKRYPELAKVIRKAVNESDVQQYITFHSLAGLVGVSGLLSMLQAAIDGDDEENQGIFRQMLGQGALNAA